MSPNDLPDDDSVKSDPLHWQLRGLRLPDPPANLRRRALEAAAGARPREEGVAGWRFEFGLLAALFLLLLGLRLWTPGPPPLADTASGWRGTLVRSLDLDPSLAAYLDFRVKTADRNRKPAADNLASTLDPS